MGARAAALVAAAAAGACRAGTPPVRSCDSLANVSLGADTTVLSAAPAGSNPPWGPVSAGCKAEIAQVCGSDTSAAHCNTCIHANVPALVGAGCPPAGQGGAQRTIDYCEHRDEATYSKAGAALAYCLVKVLVEPAINIWVGLPSDGSYTGRFQAMGGGGYAGNVQAPERAVAAGYVGASTDTGHTGGSGEFGMLKPGVPNTPLQVDFAYRSEHMMAVVSKQLIAAYYGKPPTWSYWNGCSTGGRQGLMMAQRFPADYDGIVAGAPAIHWDKFQAYQIWPQMVMRIDAGGAVSAAKQAAATAAAVAACDALDGVVDGVIRDPRGCGYDAGDLVASGDLTAGEAAAVNHIWGGARNTSDAGGELLWYGIKRGASMSGLAGGRPFPISVAQPKYWVYLDPSWDWNTLDYANYPAFFDKTIQMVEEVIGTDDADLSPFAARGGKLVMWHGWADQLIMPEGSVDYYDEVVRTVGGGDVAKVQGFARLFMAPGVGHCGGGAGPSPDDPLEAVRAWVEQGAAPDMLPASRQGQTRPLCPHPKVAVYKGTGSTDDAANFACGANPVQDDESATRRGNMRVFGWPFYRPNQTRGV